MRREIFLQLSVHLPLSLICYSRHIATQKYRDLQSRMFGPGTLGVGCEMRAGVSGGQISLLTTPPTTQARSHRIRLDHLTLLPTTLLPVMEQINWMPGDWPDLMEGGKSPEQK